MAARRDVAAALLDVRAGLRCALIIWGQHDKTFPVAGAYPYPRDLPTAELHLLDREHFALEEDSATIAALMRDFRARHKLNGARSRRVAAR